MLLHKRHLKSRRKEVGVVVAAAVAAGRGAGLGSRRA